MKRPAGLHKGLPNTTWKYTLVVQVAWGAERHTPLPTFSSGYDCSTHHCEISCIWTKPIFVQPELNVTLGDGSAGRDNSNGAIKLNIRMPIASALQRPFNKGADCNSASSKPIYVCWESNKEQFSATWGSCHFQCCHFDHTTFTIVLKIRDMHLDSTFYIIKILGQSSAFEMLETQHWVLRSGRNEWQIILFSVWGQNICLLYRWECLIPFEIIARVATLRGN